MEHLKNVQFHKLKPQHLFNIINIMAIVFSAISIESPIEPADEENSTQHQSSQEGTATMNIIGHLFVIIAYSLHIN